MRMMIATGLVIASMLHAQQSRHPPLDEGKTIAGRVVDMDGGPIKDADIAHTGSRAAIKTDAEGRFQITTNAPAIVIRKPGFRSAFLRTKDGSSDPEQRFVLKPVERSLPICSEKGKYISLEGWTARLRFSPMEPIKVGTQGHDIDYGMRYYYLNTPHGKRGIAHGSGAMWSFGTPANRDVWGSVTFEEDSFDVGGFEILDSRGEWADGTRWRTIAKLGETVSYSSMDRDTASVLDKFMDGVCVAAPMRSGR
ncbi:MAG TPA: carboxypeptidase-like regulatory domain-containing protein [Bryobacteraceae bacterium]|jgi:hypothetical protein